jgi:uncharacterized protein
MTWGKLLQPDLFLRGTVLDLTPDIVQRYKLKGLILDVDETLVPMKQTDVIPELQAWVDLMKPTLKLALLSNNISENRIGRIADSLMLPYFYGAGKPSRRKLRQAVEQMNLSPAQIGMVGDRLFTDVLAGNRLGLFTVLVDPLVSGDSRPKSHPIRDLEIWISQLLGAAPL